MYYIDASGDQGTMDQQDDTNGEAMNRRDFLVWTAAAMAMLALPGCSPDQAAYAPPPPARKGLAYAQTVPTPQSTPQYIYAQQAPAGQPAPAVRVRKVRRSASGKISAMSRNSWGATAAVPSKMKLMNGVTRITVHHEGSSKPNNDTTPTAVAQTLRLIQKQHRQRMGAGDIGYHFIIDRTGVIWQGRDWKYQGAHASGANAHNIGIVLLGNFEMQKPTAAQLDALTRLTSSLVDKYGLNPRTDIYGHSDFCNTQCPGKNLKPYVLAMKKGL